MQVTLLASSWDWSLQSIYSRVLATRLARFPSLKVTVLVPEFSCSEHAYDKGNARIHGYNIVEAKKQPAFCNPTDWLIFPPKDLSTDIVIGCGEELGQIAQIWKECNQCKNICVASDPRFIPEQFRSELHNLEQSEVNETLC